MLISAHRAVAHGVEQRVAAARKRGVVFGRRPGQRIKVDRFAPKVLKRKTWRSGDGLNAYTLTRDFKHGSATVYCEIGSDRLWCTVNEANPAEASMKLEASIVHTAEGAARRIETRAVGVLRSSEKSFETDIECTLLENDRVVRTRRWQGSVARELV